MAIAIEGPVKILTVYEGDNWNLKWPVSNTELQFSIYQEFNTFNFFFILYNMKQTNKKLKKNFQADAERFCYFDSNIFLMSLSLI